MQQFTYIQNIPKPQFTQKLKNGTKFSVTRFSSMTFFERPKCTLKADTETKFNKIKW